MSLCIHPLGTSSHVWNIKKFPLTLFSFSYNYYHWCFLPTRLVWIKHFFFPRDHQFTFIYWSSLLEEYHYLTMQYIRPICQQLIKLQSKTNFCVWACLKKKHRPFIWFLKNDFKIFMCGCFAFQGRNTLERLW